MSAHLLQNLLHSSKVKKKILAVLVDPQKWDDTHLDRLLNGQFSTLFHWVLIGGSTVGNGELSACITAVRERTSKPVILFPGDPEQIDERADALLLLSLLNSEDPEFIVGQHIAAAQKLKDSGLELIPTGYILIGDDRSTAVSRISKTSPISQSDPETIRCTVIAAEQMGKQLVYLECGSGASESLNPDILESCRRVVDIPIVVGGGIKSMKDVNMYWERGADIVVVGTAIEENLEIFFNS